MWRKHTAAAVAWILIPGAGLAQPARPQNTKDGKKRMETQAEIVSALAKLDDQFVATAPENELTKQAYSVTADMEFDGLAIRLPRLIDRKASPAIPMLAMIGQDDGRTSAAPLAVNAVLVAVHLRTGKITVDAAFPPPEQKRTFSQDGAGKSVDLRSTPGAPVPSAAVVSMRMMSAVRRDLATSEQIHWTNGDYALRILAYDWISNTAALTIQGGADAAPMVAAPVVALGRPNELPNFVDVPATAPLAGRGIVVAAPAPKTKVGTPVKLHGLLRVSASETRAGSGGQTVAGVTLLLVRRNIQTPLQVEVLVPCQQSSAGGDWIGQFTIDAAKTRPLPVGSYLAYAIVGHRMSMAVPFEVLN